MFAPLIRGMIEADAAGIPCGHCHYLGNGEPTYEGCYYKHPFQRNVEVEALQNKISGFTEFTIRSPPPYLLT